MNRRIKMKKIALVVDDTQYIREDIREMLEEKGYEVYEAENGQEGVEKYKEINPTIVTMDINMPKMHGLEASKLIKEYDENARILLCSTMVAFPNYRKMGEELGIKAFLSKPYSDVEFFEEFDKLFS